MVYLENHERSDTEKLAILRAEIQKGMDDPAFVDGEAALKSITEIIDAYEPKA